jgi:hypothetical protein
MTAFVSGAAAAVPTLPQTLVYRGSFLGVEVLDLHAMVDMRADGYGMGISFQTTGTLDFLMHSHAKMQVEGGFQAGHPAPARFSTTGVVRGRPSHIEISYPSGQPRVDVLEPPLDSEHQPVPRDLQINTMDGMSALVDLLQTVGSTGRCDGQVTTFDGRRLSLIEVTSGGQEMVPDEKGMLYHGEGLRCNITNTLLAGFPQDSKPGDSMHQPRHSSVWFAPLTPGAAPVAVLIRAELHRVGHLDLTLVGTGP